MSYLCSRIKNCCNFCIMSTGEPIYFESRPKVRYHTNADALLFNVSFMKELTEAIEDDIHRILPEVDVDWLEDSLKLKRIVYKLVKQFLNEVGRGHIFCDDLFATTFKKYVGSDIPFYCSQDITGIICYDFCMQYIQRFYKLISALYRVESQSDDITRTALLKNNDPYFFMNESMSKEHDTIIQKLNYNHKLPYLHLENNLDEVLARVEEREKAKKPAKLPYSFEDPTKDRILLDVARDIEIFNSIRICVSGKESPCRTKNNF